MGGPIAACRRAPNEWMGGPLGGALLLAVCVLALLPGLMLLPPVDRDESRFAQASRQMLESDDVSGWIVPRIGDRPRLNKPPLVYWLQAASSAVLGVEDPLMARNGPGLPTGDIWPFRLPSFLCGVIAALVTWRIGLSMFPRAARIGLLAGAMLGCSVVVMWDARQARADQLLLAMTTASMWALWKCWDRGSKPGPREDTRSGAIAAPFALWLFIGLGVMAKGPITPMVAGLTALALAVTSGKWKWLLSLRPAFGAAIVLLLVGPWVWLVAREVGWDRYIATVIDETFGRSVSSAEGHWGPPGYHLLLLPAMFWPGSMLTAAGIVLAWRTAREGAPRRWRFSSAAPAEAFLLAWLIPSWIVFEVVSTKLPHYTLPLYPALALLSARAVCAATTGGAVALGLDRRGARWGLVIFMALGVLLVCSGPVLLARLGGFIAAPPWTIVMGASIGIGAGLLLFTGLSLMRGRFLAAQCLAIAAAMTASASIFGVILPRLGSLWISSRLVNAVYTIEGWQQRPLGAVGYHEDSLTFLTAARVERLRLEALADWLDEHPGGLVVIPTVRVEAAESLVGAPLTSLRYVAGFNYSKGRTEELVIVERSR